MLFLLIPFDQRALSLFPWITGIIGLLLLLTGVSRHSHLPWGGFPPLAICWLVASVIGFQFLPSPSPPLLAGWQVFLGTAVTGAAFLALDAHGKTLHQRGMAIPAILLAIVFLSFLLSSFTSRHPDASFLNYAREGAGLHLVAAVAAMLLLLVPGGRGFLLKSYAATGGIVLLVAVLVALRTQFGDEQARLGMVGASLIRDTEIGGVFGFRLQFPQYHHNRLGYYALTVAMSLLAVLPLVGRRWVRVTLCVLFVSSSLALLFSQTRGAFLGWLVGVAVWLMLNGNWRRAWPLVTTTAVLILALLVVSPPLRERLSSPFQIDNYQQDDSTIALRRYSMIAAIDGARTNPLLGQGYGWTNFRRIYGTDYQTALGDPEQKGHAHNAFLEVWNASGLLAGLAFLALHLWAMIACWRRRRTDPAASGCLALVAGMMVFALGNTTIHHSLGAATWILLLVACSTPLPGKGREIQESSR